MQSKVKTRERERRERERERERERVDENIIHGLFDSAVNTPMIGANKETVCRDLVRQ